MNADRARLERLYHAAEYLVTLPQGTACFRIGHFDAAQEARLRAARGDFQGWTIVTPVNPRSIALCEHENLARLEDFRRQLLASGRDWLASVNHDPLQGWPDEAGALIFNLSPAEAEALGRTWQQTAVVYAEEGCAPRLLWLAPA